MSTLIVFLAGLLLGVVFCVLVTLATAFCLIRSTAAEKPPSECPAQTDLSGLPAVMLKLSTTTILEQTRICERFAGMEPVVARSKIVFNDRPTHDDIKIAEHRDEVIVARLPIPERWLRTYPPIEVRRRAVERVNSVLEELGLEGGHPRVFLLSDTCDNKAAFVQMAYKNLGVEA